MHCLDMTCLDMHGINLLLCCSHLCWKSDPTRHPTRLSPNACFKWHTRSMHVRPLIRCLSGDRTYRILST